MYTIEQLKALTQDDLTQYSDDTRTVPERIRASREAAGYTQREVGELCGYSGPQMQVLVAQWESGRRPVPMNKIKRLAQVLRIAPEKLLP